MSGKHGGHWLEREDVGDVTVVRLKIPRLVDDETAKVLFDPIYTLVDEIGRSKLVVNLGDTDYLPSMAQGKLVLLNRRTQAAGGGMVLCHLTPAAADSLAVARLTSLFTICATEEEALQSFAS